MVNFTLEKDIESANQVKTTSHQVTISKAFLILAIVYGFRAEDCLMNWRSTEITKTEQLMPCQQTVRA